MIRIKNYFPVILQLNIRFINLHTAEKYLTTSKHNLMYSIQHLITNKFPTPFFFRERKKSQIINNNSQDRNKLDMVNYNTFVILLFLKIELFAIVHVFTD